MRGIDAAVVTGFPTARGATEAETPAQEIPDGVHFETPGNPNPVTGIARTSGPRGTPVSK